MMTIRRATTEDSHSVARVHTSSVKAIRGHYTPEEIEAWAVPKKIESYEDSIRRKEFYVAEANEVILGFGVLEQESGLIEAVYVSPDAKGSGLGLKILTRLEERASTLGLQTLHLNASLNAVGFYRRAGYEAQAESTYRLTTGLEIRCVPMVKSII